MLSNTADHGEADTRSALRSIPALLAMCRVPATVYFAIRAHVLLKRPRWFPFLITPFVFVYLCLYPSTPFIQHLHARSLASGSL